jgi:hypothetical protein
MNLGLGVFETRSEDDADMDTSSASDSDSSSSETSDTDEDEAEIITGFSLEQGSKGAPRPKRPLPRRVSTRPTVEVISSSAVDENPGSDSTS